MNHRASSVFLCCVFFHRYCFEMGLEEYFRWNVGSLPSWFFNSFQVILVEFGGYAFSTIGLSLEHWLYCILFGVGTLVWQQVVTTIPARKMPKCMRWGKEVPTDADIEAALGEHGELNPDGSRRPTRHGQILWMRSLTRLQQQVSREKQKEERKTPVGVGVFRRRPFVPPTTLVVHHPPSTFHRPFFINYNEEPRHCIVRVVGTSPFSLWLRGGGANYVLLHGGGSRDFFSFFFCMFLSSSSPSSFVPLIVSFQFCSISRFVLCMCVFVCVCVCVFSPCLKFNSP